MYRSASKKLPHIFVVKQNTEQNRTKFDKQHFVDSELLSGQWAYCHKDMVVYNSSNPIGEVEVTQYFAKKLSK